jgi:Uma2 family endonuclease
MASRARGDRMITLDKFLRLPEIDEHPYQEYIDGRIEAKPSFGARASVLTGRLTCALHQYAEPRGIGEPFISLRCTFAGRSVVAAIAFLRESNIGVDEQGELADETLVPPDLHVEFRCPDEGSDERLIERLSFTTSHGTDLGWQVDPDRQTVQVYRPGRRPQRLPDDGILEGDPVLPGYRLPVAELFGWLIWRKPNRKPSSPRSEPPTPGGPSG